MYDWLLFLHLIAAFLLAVTVVMYSAVALGATRAVVLEQVLGEAVRLLAIGLVTGAVAAHFLTRSIASLLFGVGAADVPTHLVVFALLGVVTVVASYLPARRAASIDPIAALRE